MSTALQKRTKRIYLSIDPMNENPTDWTEADFTRESIEFLNRKAELEDLETDLKAHKKRLLEYFQANELKEAIIGGHKISCCKRTTKAYSRKLARDEERYAREIKEAKALEEKDGTCVITVNEYNHIKVDVLEGGDE